MSVIVGEIAVSLSCLVFEWKIPDIFSLEKNSKVLHSPEFEFLGVKRNIVLITGWPGFWELHVENKVHSSSDCLVSYTFGIKRSDGTIYKYVASVKKVQQWNNTWRTESLCLSGLQDKALIAAQNVLTVFCNLKEQYCKRATAECTTQTGNPEGINKLEKDFKDLLSSGEDSDVAMIVGDRVFRAHRAILRARSTIFASMFGHDMKERSGGTVSITDCDQETFRQLLLYVYTGKMDPLASENAYQLYQAADKYDVQDLKAECVMYMENNLSTGNFCDVIGLALRHKESALTESATQIFLKNAMQIVGTDSWLAFQMENPVEANALTLKMLNFLIPDEPQG